MRTRARDQILGNLEAFLEAAETVDALVSAALESPEENSPLWKFTYEEVFRIKRERIDPLEYNYAWYDPDSSYRDDVLSYNSALQDHADTIRGVHEKLSLTLESGE